MIKMCRRVLNEVVSKRESKRYINTCNAKR